jgi:hypothetical protein
MGFARSFFAEMWIIFGLFLPELIDFFTIVGSVSQNPTIAGRKPAPHLLKKNGTGFPWRP